ncbi:MAG: VCBS repeat-containing protein [Bacteroidota bacterium]
MRELLLLICISICFNWGISQSENWTYIPIDSLKQKWGDWAEPEWLRYFGLDAADVNQDGYLDILSGRYLYHNPGGSMTASWEKTVLDDNVDGIFLTDVDGDEFADIIAQALPNIYWYEALTKSGDHYRRRLIAQIPATSHVNSQGFEQADLFPNGKNEFLIAGNGNVYCIQIPGKAMQDELWPTKLIGKNTSDEGIGIGDIDGDGDLDVVCGRRATGEKEARILVYFENPGSFEEHWKDHVLGESKYPIDRIELADLNGDEHLEIVVAEERYPGLEPDASIYYYKRTAQADKSWRRMLILTQYSSNNLDLADVDEDGDIDILTGEHKGKRLELQLWKNDGKANFTKVILDKGKENHLGTQWKDLDGDGDLDIIGAAWDNYRWMHLWRNDRIKSPKRPQLQRQKIKEFKVSECIYEGSSHFLIHTPFITYYYDKVGGGFSRIIDQDGNDWISFKREPWGEYPASAASSFRGLPNLVYQGENDGAGHPGHKKCKSWLEGNTIFSESLSGAWKWAWTFRENYAQLEMLKTASDKKYWFLYEGTPGGKYEAENSYWGTDKHPPSFESHDFYKGNLLEASFNWMFTGVKDLNRSFFILQVGKDETSDILSFLGNTKAGMNSKDGMTVFGFGRNSDTQALLLGKTTFVIGFFPKEIKDPLSYTQLSNYLEDKFYQRKNDKSP